MSATGAGPYAPGHTAERCEAAGLPESHDRVALMAGAIARTALDALSDEGFFAEVRKEFTGAVEAAGT
jgi:hypothetical protein